MHTESTAALAVRQHGLFTRHQALARGVTPKMLAGGLAKGHWARVRRGVYRMAGAPVTELQALLAAVLAAGPGAVASHRAAAWLWGLADELFLEVTVPKSRDPEAASGGGTPPGARVAVDQPPQGHTGDQSAPHDPRPGGRPGRCPAGPGPRQRHRGPALHPGRFLRAELERAGRRGRPGTASLRCRLGERAREAGSPPSVLESRMHRLLRGAGLPRPEREHRVLDGRYRLDFAWPDARLAAEVDGYAFHASRRTFQDDRARQNDLVAAGWTVLRFTWGDVCQRPGVVAGRIGRALSASRL